MVEVFHRVRSLQNFRTILISNTLKHCPQAECLEMPRIY